MNVIGPSSLYPESWYAESAENAAKAAARIVPTVLDLIPAASVVDVGCATGAFVAAFHGHGIADCLGIDGDWVPAAELRIPGSMFRSADLRTPLAVDRRFDLAVCLEVAEHIPESDTGVLLESLAALSDVVLFSAAVPLQGGTGHVNEQWLSWWAARWGALGYVPADLVRPKIWFDREVPVYYRQNTVLLVNKAALARWPSLACRIRLDAYDLDRVHPEMWLDRAAFADDAAASTTSRPDAPPRR